MNYTFIFLHGNYILNPFLGLLSSFAAYTQLFFELPELYLKPCYEMHKIIRMYSEEFYQKKQEEFILTCLFLDRNDISLCLHNYIEIWIF